MMYGTAGPEIKLVMHNKVDLNELETIVEISAPEKKTRIHNQHFTTAVHGALQQKLYI